MRHRLYFIRSDTDTSVYFSGINVENPDRRRAVPGGNMVRDLLRRAAQYVAYQLLERSTRLTSTKEQVRLQQRLRGHPTPSLEVVIRSAVTKWKAPTFQTQMQRMRQVRLLTTVG